MRIDWRNLLWIHKTVCFWNTAYKVALLGYRNFLQIPLHPQNFSGSFSWGTKCIYLWMSYIRTLVFFNLFFLMSFLSFWHVSVNQPSGILKESSFLCAWLALWTDCLGYDVLTDVVWVLRQIYSYVCVLWYGGVGIGWYFLLYLKRYISMLVFQQVVFFHIFLLTSNLFYTFMYLALNVCWVCITFFPPSLLKIDVSCFLFCFPLKQYL